MVAMQVGGGGGGGRRRVQLGCLIQLGGLLKRVRLGLRARRWKMSGAQEWWELGQNPKPSY